MALKPVTDMSAWPSLTLEGNLIAPAMVAQIAAPKDNEETQQDYRIRKGLTLREEVSTAFRVGQSHFDAFANLENPSVEATRRFVRAFLVETFGFDDLVPADGAISFLAGGRVPIVVIPPSEERLDRRSPTLSTDRSRSPAFALQDYLNEHDEALWGLVTNGTAIRLMRDNASLTRPAYIEADLATIFTNEDVASFAVLWSLIHRTRFGVAGAPVTDCALERWRETGSREGEAARDRLAAQVEIALKVLGSGFLEANPDLAGRLKSGEANLTEWFNELLRLVYRLIFLMVAEDRNLLHPEAAKPDARKLYVEGYSLAALRAQAARAATWDKHHDRYEGIKIVFRALAHGQDALGLPALGGLFSADKLPHLETARLRNRAFMEALYRLSWLSDKAGMVPVNWRAMETEELGSVYESLLELQPQLGDDGRTLIFASEAAEQKGNQRKTTGSYYTPDNLVQALLDTALDPVLDKTEAEAADPTQALLKLSVIDPACGSGHFLLAAARRIATRVARIRAEGTPSLADFRHALRDVARCCIYGVDRNPMAVELTKVALWIETVDPGLPLGFFDAQIRCGDALLGVFDLKVMEQGIPDAAYKPLTGDDKEIAKHYAQKNKREKAEKERIAKGFGFDQARDLMRDFEALRTMPENTVEEIEAKAVRLHALTAEGASAWQLETACDLYVAAFLLSKKSGGQYAGPDGMPRRGAETVPTSGTLWEWLRGVQQFGPLFGAAIDSARTACAFHWPLEFPDVMQHGGFDVVLGNPPWERIKLQGQEFFAARNPRIANAPSKAARERLIDALEEAPGGSADRALFDLFVAAKREAEAVSEFVRMAAPEGGRYPLTGTGDSNTYALFAELASRLIALWGSVGIVVPAGLMTDSKTKDLFVTLFIQQKIDSFYCFDNALAIFPAIHRDTPFGLLTLHSLNGALEFCVEARSIQEARDPRRIFRLTADDLDLLNCNTRTAPTFRSDADAKLVKRIYHNVPPFIVDTEETKRNEWGARLFRIFDSAQDSGLFIEESHLQESGFTRNGLYWEADVSGHSEVLYVPLYEGKMIGQFDHRAGTFDGCTSRPPRGASIPEPETSQKQHPGFEVEPWYWVSKSQATQRFGDADWSKGWSFGYRFGANPTNIRTVICSIIPFAAAPHVFPQILVNDRLSCDRICGLFANLNSLVVDYVCRLKMSRQGLDAFIVKQLPILPPESYTESKLAFIIPKVLELTYTSHSVASFARDLGYTGLPFAWDEDRRAQLRADLDAFYAFAYGLNREELRYILDPADVKGPDYPSETFRVLKEKEIRQFGEYRTRRLVLEAWDRMEADRTFVSLGFGDVSDTSAVPAIVTLPPLEDIPNGAWAWAQGLDERDRVRAQLRAMAGILPSSADARRVRLATLACLNSDLLNGFLSSADRTEWQRITGQQARPNQSVVTLTPPTNAAWGAAYNELVSAAVLNVSADGSEWSAGPRLDRSTLHIDDAAVGRALFAWSRLQSVDLEQGMTQLPANIIPFIREGRLAA
jgi:hypothetical protein